MSERTVPRHSDPVEEGGASAPPLPWWQCKLNNECHCPNVDVAVICFHYCGITPPLHPSETGTEPFFAADFCAEAARLVGGPRAATHGDKAGNFQNTADLWNALIRIRLRQHGAQDPQFDVLTPHDVGCMLELLKVARRYSGNFNADDYTDAAGYAGCSGEIAAKEDTNKLKTDRR